MHVVILCGGKGSRLSERTEVMPKPLVEIGGKPILWHIMKAFSHFGHTDFILCTGYKAEMIEEYIRQNREPEWVVHCIDTGLEATKAERLLRIKKLITDDRFFIAYGDDVSDVDVNKVVEFHERKGKTVTITSVNPEAMYGIANINEDDEVVSFTEKPLLPFWINGGFMVAERRLFELLSKGELEKEVFEYLACEREIAAYRHQGFWKSMNTLKENIELNELWNRGNAPWKVWEERER